MKHQKPFPTDFQLNGFLDKSVGKNNAGSIRSFPFTVYKKRFFFCLFLHANKKKEESGSVDNELNRQYLNKEG